MHGSADTRILIVGGASLDTLEGADGRVAGGAGMYTAMAAHRSGTAVTLFAPRPEPMPDELSAVAERVTWLGPRISRDELAHFEIRYRGLSTTYVRAFFGAEETLAPDTLPADLSHFDCVHLVPLGDIGRQHAFLAACRDRGAGRISAGTALELINEQAEAAHAVMRGSDYFFMNEAEAVRLFGSPRAVRSRPEQTFFVTRGAEGALIVQGEVITRAEPMAAAVRDPTGAGDTFCGATLARLAQGRHPVMAARAAVPLAAHMTEAIGPAELLRSGAPPSARPDERIRINTARIDAIAAMIARQTDFEPFAFTGADLPPPEHPASLDYFFATALQQFGFFTTAEGRYARPLIATIAGEKRKGAFYLFRAYSRWLDSDPQMLTPAAQAELSETELRKVLAADDGGEPMPSLGRRLELARQYGRDMLALNLTPQILLERANASAAPLRHLLRMLDHIGGYKEDPLRKKSGLLAMILQQRPERFLDDTEDVSAVVDYHVMRSCLRIGLIDVACAKLAARLAARELLAEDEEWVIRLAAHEVMEEVVARSGKRMGAVDWFFFQARKRCPEMSEPQCADCLVDPVCAHRKSLFQPVRRTTFY